MNEPRQNSTSTENSFVVRLVLGLLLLLPALFVYANVQLVPALSTIAMSTQDVDILRPGANEFVGATNYTKLFSDSAFGQAAAFTLMMVAVRFLIVALVPPLVGLLIGAQRQGGRLFNRLLLALITLVISPVVLTVLWGLLTSQMWGREPSPLMPLPEWMMLVTQEGARSSIIFVDAIITLAIAAVVGGSAFIAVMRGRSLSPFANRAGIGIWLIGLLLAIASLPQTFDIPFILTRGGPARATTTLILHMYTQAFQYFDLGFAAAQAVLFILLSVVLAFLIWVLIAGLRLRLMFVPSRRVSQETRETVESSSMLSLISVPLLILIGLVSGGLILWGLWLASSNQGFSSPDDRLDVTRAIVNTFTSPWSGIWLTQIPVTYLAALSLGFLKPINRVVSHILFLIFLIIAFIPMEALIIQWFVMAREAGVLNTPAVTGFPWMTGAFSLVVFKLFFDGASEKFNAARESGQTTNDAFLNTVFLPSLPIVILVGAVLSFMSAQSLLWPLIVSNDPDLFSLPLSLLMVRQDAGLQQGVLAGFALGFIGIMTLIFLPIFALLHIFVLDRLALVAGPPVELDLLTTGKQKLKRDENDLELV